MSNKKYDFVIVGTGLAGLFLAHTLRQRNPNKSILMIEKGAREKGQILNFRQRDVGIPITNITQFGGNSNVWGKGLTVPHEVSHLYSRRLKLVYMRSVIRVLKVLGVSAYRDIISINQKHTSLDEKQIYMLRDNYELKENLNFANIDIIAESELLEINISKSENFLKIQEKSQIFHHILAKKIIFCCGAVETAKTLEKLRLLNNYKKYLYDHPSAYIGILEPNTQKIDKSYIITNILKNGNEIKHCFTTSIEKNIKVGIYLKPITQSVQTQRKIDRLGTFYHARRSIGIRYFLLEIIKSPTIVIYALLHKYFNTRVIGKVAIYVILEMLHEAELKQSKTELIQKINSDINVSSLYKNALQQIKYKLKSIGIQLTDEILIDWHSAAHLHGTLKNRSYEINQENIIENFKIENFNEIYVCDASLIPKEGHSNLGLTIMALADYLGRNI